ncbi:hypothetical protein [Tenacibaculum finnmarkense]|uniref:hypothetical protein n=1 Tax=Tenacibaculum finnmarkense TaxID=2781243 RepID=UPI001EFAE42C|nr:hypothetical protein [Tenacibaculum finnmarkense]MCG8732425.1 hypothetical protein [Tenacibaculum finnmarkense]MCG8801787.1 hypothetical protein [Tenacibaculum finnmarkense]MCG8806595.1 hypothetical protein [Tenacibaculum finnmarkense]MCG8816835.1 hypothetical protein [Tenacibaculum finnmarkense]MCG8824516.1 hypothetical protein [Tenacibaculum finnmarkense]
MKIVLVIISVVSLMSFTTIENATKNLRIEKEEITLGSSISLVNDTKDKVSIYTGTGFVSLNKGSKTSISCKVGKEVRWANKGRKGKVIFKIESKHCGKTLKLSKL